jgi:hypothetical protein
MIESSDIRMKKIPLRHGTGNIPALGFGTLIPDATVTITATRDALSRSRLANSDLRGSHPHSTLQ